MYGTIAKPFTAQSPSGEMQLVKVGRRRDHIINKSLPGKGLTGAVVRTLCSISSITKLAMPTPTKRQLSFCLNTTQFVFEGTYYKQVFGNECQYVTKLIF